MSSKVVSFLNFVTCAVHPKFNLNATILIYVILLYCTLIELRQYFLVLLRHLEELQCFQ